MTEVSGRGVGMDVIATTMEKLKGEALIKSAFGKGTTLSLKIPLNYYQDL